MRSVACVCRKVCALYVSGIVCESESEVQIMNCGNNKYRHIEKANNRTS